MRARRCIMEGKSKRRCEMSKSKIKRGAAQQGALAQVAEQAQVSIGTVSRAFNNSALIPSETRSRIMKAARELGFRPRVGVRTKQIALITEPPWKTRMGGYVNTLTQHICFALSRENAGIAMITEDRIGQLSDCWYDGIIGIAWEEETIARLKAIENVPIVWLSNLFQDCFHTIYLDSEATGRLAGEHLLGKGHRKIAVIHETDYTGMGRVRGVAQAMAARGLDPANCLLELPNTSPMHLSVKQLIEAGSTAVWVTGEDLKVLEANWLIQELAGKRVPEDISLMGFENPGISEFQRPSLTTIASPLREIAEKAVETVLQEGLEDLVNIQMQVKLIERNSVSRIA